MMIRMVKQIAPMATVPKMLHVKETEEQEKYVLITTIMTEMAIKTVRMEIVQKILHVPEEPKKYVPTKKTMIMTIV